MSTSKRIGILTAGGDSPGLNAAIRGVGKAAIGHYGMELIGFRDGITGLVENRYVPLDGTALSGILTIGGTILGTSRDKVHKMPVDGEAVDMVPTVAEQLREGEARRARPARRRRHGEERDAADGGRAQRAHAAQDDRQRHRGHRHELRLRHGHGDRHRGHRPACTRTAHSHHRIILTEIMGHNAGWLTLGAGIAGGADVILIPEIPYSVETVAETIKARPRGAARSVSSRSPRAPAT